jgi:Flp pilus assembly protein TadD
MIVHYLRLAIWPRGLVALYGWPLPLRLIDVLPQALFVAMLVLVVAIGIARRWKLAFPAAMFFIVLAPTSSIVPIATEVGAERRMYLPLAALVCLAVVCLWLALTKGARPLPAAIVVAAGLFAVPLSAATMSRNGEYASGVALARSIVERRPTGIAHQVLGEELMAAADHEAAIRELQEAVHQGDSRALFTLGSELFIQGRYDEAIEDLQAFVKTAALPQRPVPHWLEPSADEILLSHVTLGRAYAVSGKWHEAVGEFQAALMLKPGDPDLQHLLADAFFSAHDFDRAIQEYRVYLTQRSSDVDALGNFGVSLAATGNLSEATEVFRRAVEVDPQNPTAQRNLAMALGGLRAEGSARR